MTVKTATFTSRLSATPTALRHAWEHTVGSDHAPMALDEIRGLARGSGLSYPHAFFAATRDGSSVASA